MPLNGELESMRHVDTSWRSHIVARGGVSLDLQDYAIDEARYTLMSSSTSRSSSLRIKNLLLAWIRATCACTIPHSPFSPLGLTRASGNIYSSPL